MSITDAVERSLVEMTTLNGRASRRQFALFTIFAFMCTFTLLFATVITSMYEDVNPLAALVVLLIVPATLLTLAIAQSTLIVRRLHDAGLSAWWTLLAAVPLLGVLIIGAKQSQAEANKWGATL